MQYVMHLEWEKSIYTLKIIRQKINVMNTNPYRKLVRLMLFQLLLFLVFTVFYASHTIHLWFRLNVSVNLSDFHQKLPWCSRVFQYFVGLWEICINTQVLICKAMPGMLATKRIERLTKESDHVIHYLQRPFQPLCMFFFFFHLLVY